MASSAEATKSDLAEGRELLAQRGEKLSQLADSGAELASDASNFSKMAKQLAGSS